MTRTNRWRRLRYAAAGVLASVLVLALVAVLLGVLAVRRPFPTYDGDLTIDGLAAPVTVLRDDVGVPHLYAESLPDLFRAQGFVHAQDRFWEMDLRRHITSGRTAELFGADQVETDTFLRTLGWREVAEQEWALVSPQTQEYLTAYAEGVNAWIDTTGGPAATGRKALQYRVLGLRNSGYEVAPWHPVDSLAWLKAMAWDLRSNLVAETERALLRDAGLSRDQIEQLYPPYPADRHQPIVPGGAVRDGEFDPTAEADTTDTTDTDAASDPDSGGDDAGSGDAGIGDAGSGDAGSGDGGQGGEARIDSTAVDTGLAGHGTGTPDPGRGSNSWVVSGEHTESGAPLLVNDPHLSISLPGIWYQAGLHCDCGYQASGFTFSGLPGVVIGHNGRIAWGLTNLGYDVTDLYLEKLDGDRYQVDGEWRELELRQETIRVAGADDVTITVRKTHRGPLVSDASEQFARIAGSRALARDLGAAGHAERGLSLAWTALTPGTTIEALFGLNQATDFDSFRAAAAEFEVPAQNLVYADVDGTIGYQAPGRAPVRQAGDGRWPAPGWDSDYDWQDTVPFEELPYLQDPPTGQIVTANQAPIGPQYQPWQTDSFSYGYRSDRIHTMLEEATAAGPVTADDMAELVTDSYHPFAPVLVPALLAVPSAALVEGAPGARVLFAGWDFQQPAQAERETPQARSSAAAAYFNATWRHLLRHLFDELPDDLMPNGRDRWFEVVAQLLEEPDSPWWDDESTPETETRDDILVRALSDAYLELSEDQSWNPIWWRWGRMHQLHLRDATFGDSGIDYIEGMFNRGPFAASGGADAVNATSWDASEGYEVVAGPSMRMVVDLADFDNSRWVQATGNSGHAYHPHYTDQVEPWLDGELLSWRWDRASVESETAFTLTLNPAG